MKRKTKHYYAIWHHRDNITITRANVSFDAVSDDAAIKRANKIAVEVNSVNSPRTITCEGRTVQMINTGVSG